MNRLFGHLALFSVLAVQSHAPAEGLPQSQRIERLGDNTYLRLDGVPGRTYFFQTSKPGAELKEWLWLPEIKSGTGAELSLEVDGTAVSKFFRMKYTDQPVPEGQTAGTADFDGDGLSNLAEVSIHATDPFLADSDTDMLPDGWEVTYGLHPTSAGDGNNLFPGSDITYAEAFQSGLQNHPNATLADLDGDGIENGEDADPYELLIDWQRAPVASYAVIDLNMEPLVSFFPPHSRFPVDAILNDHGQIIRRPDLAGDEKTPAVWDGTTLPPVWTNAPDYLNESGTPEIFDDLYPSFNNAGNIFFGLHLDDGSDGSAGLRSVTIKWEDLISQPQKYGTYDSETHRLVEARFDSFAINEHIYHQGQGEEQDYETRTITAGSFTIAGVDSNMPNLGRFNVYSRAPAISRTGKVVIHQSGQTTVNTVPIPTDYIFGLTADPHGNDLIATWESSSEQNILSQRHYNGAWEKMPLPGIMDMNAAGTGITFPGHQLWVNGTTIELDDHLAASGWSEFKAEQINANGLVLGSAKPAGAAAHKPVLLLPSVIEQYDFETAKASDGVFAVTPADPRPEVDMQLATAEVNASGQLEVRVTGTVRDQLSEVIEGQRISELRFSVNGAQVKAINLNFGPGQAPWTVADSLNTFDETILFSDPKPGGYEIRAETDANAAGNTGWDRVATGLTREDDPNAPQEVFSQLSVVSSNNLSGAAVDALTVYFGNRAPEAGDAVFTETADNSLQFEGSLLLGGTATDCTLRIKDFTASAGGATGHFSLELSYTPAGGEEIRIVSSLEETAAGSLRFYPDGFQVNAERNSVQAMPDLGGSQGEDIQPLLMKVGLPEALASQAGFQILVNGTPHTLKKFTYGGKDSMYVVNSTTDTHPKIFVPCVHALPAANLLPGCDLPGEAIRWEMELGGQAYLLNETLVLPGRQLDEQPALSAPPEEFTEQLGASPPERWQQPGDTVTYDDLIDAYKFIYTDTISLTLLQVYLQQGHEISLEDVYEDYAFSYNSRPGTKALIEIEHDDNDIHPGICAQYLWRGLTKALTIFSFRGAVAEALNENTLEIDAIIAYKAEVGPAAAEVGIAAAELYLSGIGIVNEPADWLLVVNDVSEGNYASLTAALPFISRGLVTVGKGIRIENRAGQVLGRLDAESFPALRDAMATGNLETVGTVLDQYELSKFIGKLIATDGSKINIPKREKGLKEAMRRRVPKPGELFEAHHDLPWSERAWFAERGVNVNKPAFGRWVHKKEHDLWHQGAGGGGFHQFWYDFMDEEVTGPRKTVLDILAALEECRQQFPVTIIE